MVKHTFLDWNGQWLVSSTENMYQFLDITQRENSVIDSTRTTPRTSHLLPLTSLVCDLHMLSND